MIFLFLLFVLYLSQLFIISPGMIKHGDLALAQSNDLIAGLSSSSLACILIIIYSFSKIIFFRNTKVLKFDAFLLFFILLFFSVGFAAGIERIPFSSAINYSIKLLMPFIIFFYMVYSFKIEDINKLYTTILLINIMLIVQVLLCQFLIGSFSANRFYWYMTKEEYYGFYNSPHPFAALLGLLSLWNIKSLLMKKWITTNLLLLFFNFLLIVLSGVRTYLVAFVFSVVLIYCYSFVIKNRFKYLSIILFFVFVSFLLIFFEHFKEIFFSTRIGSILDSSKVLSGRDIRWFEDFLYYLNSYDIFEKIFGRGFGSVYLINNEIFNTYINSLNGILDLLLDHGIFGALLLIFLYISVLVRCQPRSESGWFFWIFVFYLFLGFMVNNILPYVTIMPLAIIFLAVYKFEVDNINIYSKV